MNDNHGSMTIITPGLIRELRDTARRPTSVRELTNVIQTRLGFSNDAVIPVLAGFCHAFRLPLIKVLPIREWIGTANDAEIDALILPEIEQARPNWDSEPVESAL